jgi:predicted nucleotidyltransferase component of viral defense system
LEIGQKVMPLSSLQKEIVQTLAKNRSEESHLAGGSALHFSPNSIRYSNDLDYFHDSENAVAEAFEKDRKTLESVKFAVTVELHQPGFIRAVVTKKSNASKIEWAHDSAWRFMPTQKSKQFGYILHPVDLAVNKVLALVGRDEARDYLDIHDIHKRTLSLGSLCWAACGKDPGFTPTSILDLLLRRGKYHSDDFRRLKLVKQPDLVKLKTDWQKMLSEADYLISSLPSDEAGCLYYSLKQKNFLDPPVDDRPSHVVPHFGTLKGVLPKILNG